MSTRLPQVFPLLCLLLSFISLSAQSYVPVVINGEVFFRTELETSEGIIAAEVTVANFIKIEGQLYNRVFFKRGFGADQLVGYLRENPGTSEIYFRTVDDPQEYLIFDLRLEEGDMINLQARWCDGQAGDMATVVAVNQVGDLRELVFDREVGDTEFCEPLRFLEGVGPNATLIYPLFRDAILENGTAQRICFASHENIIFYPSNSNVDLCGGSITSTDEVAENSLRVFPNPAQDQINFSKLPANSSLQVFTSQGQLLGTYPASPTIDCSHWPSGMYLVKVNAAAQSSSIRVLKM